MGKLRPRKVKEFSQGHLASMTEPGFKPRQSGSQLLLYFTITHREGN